MPQGVDVKVEGPHVAVKAPKGALTVPFVDDYIAVNLEGDTVQVTCDSQEKSARSLHGLTRTLIANAVAGVTEGFSKNLDLFGVGWRAEAQGSKLTLHVGYSHPVVYDAPEGINIQVGNGESGSQARITVNGIDKQVVGQVAADIRFKRKPEPYKGKGVRYADEYVKRKEAKKK